MSERLGSASFLDAERASTSWTYSSYSADNDGQPAPICFLVFRTPRVASAVDAVAAEGLDILHLFHSSPLGQRAGEALEQRHDRKCASENRKKRRDVVVPPFGGSI